MRILNLFLILLISFTSTAGEIKKKNPIPPTCSDVSQRNAFFHINGIEVMTDSFIKINVIPENEKFIFEETGIRLLFKKQSQLEVCKEFIYKALESQDLVLTIDAGYLDKETDYRTGKMSCGTHSERIYCGLKKFNK